MKRLIITLLFISFTQTSFSAPVVLSISGPLVNGGTLVIQGSNISAKATAAPLLWDNVESGAASGAWTQLDAGIEIYTGSGQPVNSTNCFRMDKSLQTAFNMKKVQEITNQLYTFVKRKYAYDMTYDNHKFFRVWQSGVEDGYVKDSLAWNYLDGYDNPKYHMRRGEGTLYDPANPIPTHIILLTLDYWPQVGVWQTDEFFIQLETGIGVYDGVMGYRLDNNRHRSWATNRGNFDEHHNFPYTDIYVDNYSHDHTLGNGPDYYYVDDVYIDKTWARVMIGDDPNFDDCSSLEIQIPTAWDSGSGEISITLNQGAMDSFVGKYLFIVDSSNVPSSGHLLSESEHDSPTITGPDDFNTTASSVEIEGTYYVDPDLPDQSVIATWTLGEASGFCVAALGVLSCTVPVELGTNSIVFEITDSNSGTDSDTTVVTRTAPPISSTSTTHGYGVLKNTTIH